MSAVGKCGALLLVVVAAWFSAAGMAQAQANATDPREVLLAWNQMVLQLTRHTPTYTPPVASRTYAYLGVAAYEAVASGSDTLQTLSGQLNGLAPSPRREAGKTYDEAVLLEAAMSAVIHKMFENTGPTGQRAFQALQKKLGAQTSAGGGIL